MLVQKSIFLLLVSSLFLISSVLHAYPLENESFSEHGKEVDNFIQRTVSRMNESWNLAAFEFKLAFRYFSEEKIQKAQNDLKSRADEAVKDLTDKAADKMNHELNEMKDKAAEHISTKIEQAKKQAQETAEGAVEQATAAGSDAMEQAKSGVRSTAEKVTDQ